MDRELGTELGLEASAAALVEAHVPPGWAADIRSLPRLGHNESRRPVKAFLQREMKCILAPAHDDEEVEIREPFEQGELRVILFPQSRHGLGKDTKVALQNAIGYFPNDEAVLRGAVRRKYAQLKNLDGPTLVALNMFSTTSSREDLDQALFGVTVSERDVHGDEVRQYFQPDGIFAGGSGDPTISGVLAFTEVGVLRCADPILWQHPRFGSRLPQALNDLEIRMMPGTEPEVRVQEASKRGLLESLGFVTKH
jgi:hypothetical protein